MNDLSTIITKTINRLESDYIKQWASSIANNHENILKLPKRLRDKIIRAYNILNEMCNCVYRYNHLHSAGLIDGAKHELHSLFGLMGSFYGRNNLHKRTITGVDVNFAISELENFMKKHIEKVGMEQAMKDFQVGLNLLNKNKKDSIIQTKRQLKEDGDFGKKTLACFCDICKNYTPRVIKKYIRLGAIANVVFNTKNNSRINTDKLVCTICEDLKG